MASSWLRELDSTSRSVLERVGVLKQLDEHRELRAQKPQYWYYYLVRDQNSGYFNTGIKITPSVSEASMIFVQT